MLVFRISPQFYQPNDPAGDSGERRRGGEEEGELNQLLAKEQQLQALLAR